MLLPYNTDAPVYHFPWATIGLIAVNVAIFAACMAAPDYREAILPWALELGNGLHPVQWLTANFIHLDVLHLAGNMLVIWPLGLVVEGKVGWWRFLAICSAIGVVRAAGEQLLALWGETRYEAGASAIVYGLIAMAVIWAPSNNLSCFLWVGFRFFAFEMQILWFAFGFVMWQTFLWWLGGYGFGTEFAHLSGFFVGLPIAIVMLRRGAVNCEGWDFFTVWRGEEGRSLEEEPPPQRPQTIDLRRAEAETRDVAQQLQRLLQQGEPRLALARYAQLRARSPNWRLPEGEHRKLIVALDRAQALDEVIPLMVEYLRFHPQQAVRMRLRLAQVLLQHAKRPAQALAVLQKLPADRLEPSLEAARRTLTETAQQQRQTSGEIEIAPEEW